MYVYTKIKTTPNSCHAGSMQRSVICSCLEGKDELDSSLIKKLLYKYIEKPLKILHCTKKLSAVDEEAIH